MTCTSVANSIVDLIVLIYSRIHYVQPNKIVDGLLFLGRSPNGVMKIKRPSMLPMSNSCPLARSQVKSLEETLKSEKGPSCFFGATRNEWMNEWIPWGVKHHWAQVIVFFGVMWVENERGFFGALFGSTVDGPNQVLRNKQPTIYSIYPCFFSGQKMGGDIFAPVRSVKNWEVCVETHPRGDATDWFENPSRTRRTTATSEEFPHTTEGWRVGPVSSW